MTESQRKWLRSLLDKGVKFDFLGINEQWVRGVSLLSFSYTADQYGISSQAIPDIPEWREVCMEMRSKGVWFEYKNFTERSIFGGMRESYHIPQQPLPEWREKMTEETKPEPPDTPHRDLQIQWHEDKIHSLETGEPMREWEWRSVYDNDNSWTLVEHSIDEWESDELYRRKPRTVKYWHCVVEYVDNVGDVHKESFADTNRHIIECRIKTFCNDFKHTKFTPIIETVAELED